MKKLLFLGLLMLFSITLTAQEKGHFQILIGYENDMYSKPYDRNFTILHGGFGYKSNLAAIYGNINLGYLYKTPDGVAENIQNKIQYEFDYYQSLSKSKSTSFWLNYAYSQDLLFPNHRFIGELWQKLPAHFLISGGETHYIYTGGNATILNVGLENYFGRYWLEFKTYFFLKQPSTTYSYFLTGRIFFKDVNYLQLSAGIGSAQDEPFILTTDLNRLDAKTTSIKYVTNIFKARMRISGGFTYMYEQYQADVWRNRYAFGVGLIYNITKP
jgi:YaiO family outer membrane protein